MTFLIRNLGRALPALLLPLLLWQAPLQAHEFWLEPPAHPLAVGQKAALSLMVGEQFTGVLVGFSAPQTAAIKQYTATGSKDLRALLPAVPAAALPIPLTEAGAHLFAFDSEPHVISLSADAFHAYLHDEGLDFIKARREAAGTAAQPGRERYRRHVKTLLNVAGTADNRSNKTSSASADKTYATVVGQRLELVPLNNPLTLVPGGSLDIQVLFENKPLPGALIKAWHKRGSQTLIVRAIAGADGKAMFELPYAGAWMVSVVHMVPAVGVPEVDWDSLWGNLTFVVPARGKKP